jgi:hypothetical protein
MLALAVRRSPTRSGLKLAFAWYSVERRAEELQRAEPVNRANAIFGF